MPCTMTAKKIGAGERGCDVFDLLFDDAKTVHSPIRSTWFNGSVSLVLLHFRRFFFISRWNGCLRPGVWFFRGMHDDQVT